jgi:hypothetical protein
MSAPIVDTTEESSAEQSHSAAEIETPTESPQPETFYVGGDGAASADSPASQSRKELGDDQVADVTAAEQDRVDTTDGADSKTQPLSESPLHADIEAGEGLQPQADATQINYQATENEVKGNGFPVDEIAEELDSITDDDNSAPNGAPHDVVAEFFAEKRANPDFEVHEVVREFEEVSEEFDQQPPRPLTDDLYANPVEQLKSKATGLFGNLNSKFAQIKRKFAKDDADSVPDFNAPPSFENYAPPPASADDDIPHISEFFNDERVTGESAPNYGATAHHEEQQAGQPIADALQNAEPEPGLDNVAGATNWNIGGDAQPEHESSESRAHQVGDTLRHYKEKLSKGQMVAYESGGELAPLDSYKQRITHWYSDLSVENRGTVGGVILLFIGLLIGASAMSLFEQPISAISNDKVEQLAIDAHILYTQQDQNFAGETSTSITESMQWLSARIGKLIRLADAKLEGYEHERAIVIPSMVNYATANIFSNKDRQKITLFIAASNDEVRNSPLSCRIPTAVDGLCSWVQESVHYVVVANLSLSRVRAFSQQLIQQL